MHRSCLSFCVKGTIDVGVTALMSPAPRMLAANNREFNQRLSRIQLSLQHIKFNKVNPAVAALVKDISQNILPWGRWPAQGTNNGSGGSDEGGVAR